jgi:hypothetical protein
MQKKGFVMVWRFIHTTNSLSIFFSSKIWARKYQLFEYATYFFRWIIIRFLLYHFKAKLDAIDENWYNNSLSTIFFSSYKSEQENTNCLYIIHTFLDESSFVFSQQSIIIIADSSELDSVARSILLVLYCMSDALRRQASATTGNNKSQERCF